VTDLDSRRPAPTRRGGPTVRPTVDAFLDAPTVGGHANTLRAYTGVLDRAAAELGPDRPLAAVADDEMAATLSGLWGAATWNRNRAAVGSWLAWCADKQHRTAPVVPAEAERCRENVDETKSVSRSRIDRLCRRRDIPLREKTLWRMLYETSARAAEVLSLNIENWTWPTDRHRSSSRAATPGGSPGAPTPPACCPG
jgi:integrase